MNENQLYKEFNTPAYANNLSSQQVFDYSIKPILENPPRIAGPAFPILCPKGDALNLHKAIYLAEPGSVLVVQASDTRFAVLGSHFAELALQLGIEAIIVDGVIRDKVEIQQLGYPVFAKGVSPLPSTRNHRIPIESKIICGGAVVHKGDIVIADEEGIVVLPKEKKLTHYELARQVAEKEKNFVFSKWQKEHYMLIEDAWR